MHSNSTIRAHRPRRSATLVAGALALSSALVCASSTVTAAQEAPPVADGTAGIVGWMLSERFPNVRAWPESFDSLAFPNRCLYLSIVVCP